jgi:hypothetical protein
VKKGGKRKIFMQRESKDPRALYFSGGKLMDFQPLDLEGINMMKMTYNKEGVD